MARYEWKEMPSNYNANYYNKEDLQLGRTFVIIDTKTGLEYTFPKYEYKRNKYGNNVKTNIIDSSLWNQEFFNWICSTSPDFCINIPEEFMTPELIDICVENTSDKYFINEIPKLTQEICMKFVKRFPNALRLVPDFFVSEEMIKELIKIDQEVIKIVSDSKITDEMCKLCYELGDINIRQYLINHGYMKNYVTRDIFLELIEKEVKINLEKIPRKFITENISHSLFEKDKSYFSTIPNEHKTYDMCLLAIKESSHYISFVPKELQTLELIKMVLDDDWKKISSVNIECLTEEIITYAVNKNGLAISGIPKEMRTKELCELAVKKNVKAFRFIPDQFKTKELCRYSVILEPSLIKCVPSVIITEEFIEELRRNNIIISSKYMPYVQDSIAKNKEYAILLGSKENEPEQKYFEEYKDISIMNLNMYFSIAVINALAKMNIATLEDLFVVSTKQEFISLCYKSKFRNEILGTTKILKCKYLNEDPEINIDDEEQPFISYARMLGFSTRAINVLRRGGWSDYSFKGFIERMNEVNIDQRLSRLRNMGDSTKSEILLKVKIITDYYSKKKDVNDSKQDSENDSSDINNIKKLYDELKQLIDERKILDSKIEFVMSRLGNNFEQSEEVKKLIK